MHARSAGQSHVRAAQEASPAFACVQRFLTACVTLQARFEEGYINEGDPSVLRFLIASREEVSANQLRDDLLSMLVAGHETTASVLTWTFYLLANNPEQMQKVRQHCSDVD